MYRPKHWKWAAPIIAALACLLWFVRPKATSFSATLKHDVVTARDQTFELLQEVHIEQSSLAGTVRTLTGRAVESARVCATDVTAASAGSSCVDTDARGVYSLAPIASGTYAIGAQADGFLPGFYGGGKDVLLGKSEAKGGLDIVLEEGGVALEGVVLDATGGPIAGALVRATSGPMTLQAISTASHNDGRFTLRIRPGMITLRAEASGYASTMLPRVAPSRDIVLTLTPSSSVQGIVVAESDGRPVPGISVRSVPVRRPNLASGKAGTSQANGAFLVQDLEPGVYTLLGEGMGWRGISASPVQVGLAQNVDHVTLKVSTVAQVTGKVLLRSSGQPCTQGSVTLGPRGVRSAYDPPSALDENERTTVPTFTVPIAGGEVHFQAVPSGTYHVVVQCAQNVLSEGPTSLEVGQKDLQDLVWKVDAGLGLVVHVMDEANVPIPNTRFRLLWPPRKESDSQPVVRALSDAEGRYEFDGVLWPGDYTLAPEDGHQGAPVVVALREGMGKVDATLRLAGRGSILVTAQTPTGEPVDSVTVTAELVREPLRPRVTSSATNAPPQTISSEAAMRPMLTQPTIAAAPLGNGRFRIAPLSAGKYRVRVTDGVNAPVEPERSPIDVANSPVEALITLHRGATLRGRVVDGSRQALPDVWVSATCQTDSHGPASAFMGGASAKRVLSDTEGRFVLNGLQGRATCTVRAEDLSGAVATTHDVHPGDDAIVVISDSGTLRGTSVTTTGDPVEQFIIWLSDTGAGPSRTESVTATGGHWTLPHVMPGHWRIRAESGAAQAQQEADVTSRQITDQVRLEFRKLQPEIAAHSSGH
ncbi:MAG: carboxypeptidase-like regulatory domain-containing protein [Myxococcota bacterium]|nr:carboxypeptidase-like regulatory domain-containing protein [Myxococcota bacterium]